MDQNNNFELANQVQNVYSIQIEYIKRYWWISLPLIIIGIIILKIGWNLGNAKLLNIGVIVLCLELFVIVIGLIFANQEASNVFMKRMAIVLGFSYKANGIVEKTKAEIFRYGYNKEMTNVLYGTYQNMPLWIYNLKISTGGQSKNAVSYRYTVFEFTFTQILPRLILLKKSIFNERVGMTDKVQIKLEGNFNKYFELYTEKSFERDVRQVFTPDVMALLIDEASNINFETCENKIFIYKEKFITKKEELLSMYIASQIVTKKLIPNFESVKRQEK